MDHHIPVVGTEVAETHTVVEEEVWEVVMEDIVVAVKVDTEAAGVTEVTEEVEIVTTAEI